MNLQQAAHAGDVAAIAKLLDDGAPIDAADHNGMTALLEAIYGKHLAAAELLVARGASFAQKSLSGIDARRAAAELLPALVPALVAKGATPWTPVHVDWIATDAMGKYTRALIESFRSAHPLDEDHAVMAYVDHEMPADLRALLQAWAHAPGSAWINLGRFEIEKRALGRGTAVGEAFANAPEEEQIDWARAVRVGSVYGGPTLLVTWAPGKPNGTWVIADDEYQTVDLVGDFEALIDAATAWAEEQDEKPKGLAELTERAG